MPPVFEITNGYEHDAFIANNPRGIIFFGSNGCGHCRHIAPTYERLTTAYPQVAFAHVEVTRVKTENVDGVPVFVAYRNGEYFDMVLGASERDLLELIRRL